jgi:hypothetical protein
LADLLKGLTGGSWALLIAWFLPAGVVVGILGLVVYPAVAPVGFLSGLGSWDTPTRELVAGFTVVVLAVAGNALSTQLYQVLEGYALWPQWLFDARSRHHAKRKMRLVNKAAALPAKKALTRDRALQRARVYPDEDGEIGPTKLQNAIRAFEIYGKNRYGIESQVLWTELLFVAPKGIEDEIDRARASVDFFVALWYSTVLVSVCAFVAVLSRWLATGYLHIQLLGFAAAVLALCVFWYRGAVASVAYWRSTVQALVNLGRVPLASAVGLTVPTNAADERVMWDAFYDFVYSPYDLVKATSWDRFRTSPPQVSDNGLSGRKTLFRKLLLRLRRCRNARDAQ